jgi:hypothetical protein
MSESLAIKKPWNRLLPQNQKGFKGSELFRFLKRIKVSDGCWEWDGGHDSNGYGRFALESRKQGYAHIYAYQKFVGPVPKGLELDHTCRNPGCCNPKHLEAVSHRINANRGISPWGVNSRKTICKRGHPLNDENVRVYKGLRVCKACQRLHQRAFKKGQKLI